MKNYKLLTPGPVPVPDWLLKELAQPILHHRTDEFSQIMASTLTHLKKVFQTDQPCMILNASGTGAMEAAIVNCVQRGDQVLSIDAGKFGERWHNMAQALGYKSSHLKFSWERDIDVQLVKKTLQENKNIKAVLCQASETSTGALLPIKELAEITKNTDVLLIVDGITAVGCVNLPMDDWGIDILITGSQKAFMMPTGLSFISASEKAWAKIKTIAPQQTYYWNLLEELKAQQKNQTHFSSAVTLITALDAVLKYFVKQGIDNLHNEIALRAKNFRQWVLNDNIQLFAQTPSPSLTCLTFSPGVDSKWLQKNLQDRYGIVVMGGQDELVGKALRIGHMGDIKMETLKEAAEAIQNLVAEAVNV